MNFRVPSDPKVHGPRRQPRAMRRMAIDVSFALPPVMGRIVVSPIIAAGGTPGRP